MLRVLSVGLILLVSVVPAWGQCRTLYFPPVVRVLPPPVVVAPAPVVVTTLVTPVLAPVAVFQPFPVLVPAYTAGYNPAYPGLAATAPPLVAAPTTTPAATTGDLAETLRRIEARLQKLEGPPSPPPLPPTAPGAVPLSPPPVKQSVAPGAALALLTSRCSVCHARGSEGEGGGFVLLEGGKLAVITPRQLARVGTRTYLREMPPAANPRGMAPLSDEEVAILQAFVNDTR